MEAPLPPSVVEVAPSEIGQLGLVQVLATVLVTGPQRPLLPPWSQTRLASNHAVLLNVVSGDGAALSTGPVPL